MRISNYALDLIATNLSEFTSPEIPELPLHDNKTLQNSMLAGVIGVFSGEGNASIRHLITNIVRRVFASIETYHLGQQQALEYVNGDRHQRFRPYFLALTHFESCISNSWQVADMLAKLGEAKVFKKGDGSAWERLHSVHTFGSKHTYSVGLPSDARKLPTSIWLTNDGIDSLSGAHIAYVELAGIIGANNNLFYSVQDAAIKKLKKQRAET